MTHAAVALDLGGTKTAGALITATGEILGQAAEPTPAQRGASAVMATAASVSRTLLDEAKERGIEVRPVLGIGSAGAIDPYTGNVLSATPNIRDWTGAALSRDLAALLEDVPGRPITTVRPVNDVHAHALGEALYRKNHGMTAEGTMFLVAFGTGVGGAMLIDGKPQVGRHFVAGHVGMTPMPHHRDSELFAAGSKTPEHMILENACGGVAFADAYRSAGGQAELSTAREVFARADEDASARRVIKASAEISGAFLGGIVNMIDPDELVLSGGLAASGPSWWEPMIETFLKVRLPGITTRPVAASSGDMAALLGAASLAWSDRNPAAPTD